MRLAGRDLLALSEEEMRDIRGNDISMIFQEPMTSAQPGDDHRQADRRGVIHAPRGKAALARAVEMLDLVRIPSPERATNIRTSSRAACASAR